MRSLVLYLHMHQPFRVKHYSIFAVGHDHDYWTDKDWYAGANNERVFKKVAEKSYAPMLKLLLRCLEHFPEFKLSLSITGVWLEQAETWAPELITLLQKMTETGRVEIVGETYYHSLAFFYNREEFASEVAEHRAKIQELFGQTPRVLRNTELAYNDDVASWAEEHGYRGVLAEGWDKILGDRSPNYAYSAYGCNELKLLLRNYRRSDDIAFRFSDKRWPEWPLTVDKYLAWLYEDAERGLLTNLMMDFETFGENIWRETGIFEFFESLVERWLGDKANRFLTVSEACNIGSVQESVSMPWTVSWADAERDLTAWLGNSMQQEAISAVYELRDEVLASNDTELITDWRRLLTSDHVYYMCTKYFQDGDVHSYFSPYDSPFDAFSYFMNSLRDIKTRLAKAKPAATDIAP